MLAGTETCMARVVGGQPGPTDREKSSGRVAVKEERSSIHSQSSHADGQRSLAFRRERTETTVPAKSQIELECTASPTRMPTHLNLCFPSLQATLAVVIRSFRPRTQGQRQRWHRHARRTRMQHAPQAPGGKRPFRTTYSVTTGSSVV